MDGRAPKQRSYNLKEMIQHLTRMLTREQSTQKPGDRTISYTMDNLGQFTRCEHTTKERVF